MNIAKEHDPNIMETKLNLDEEKEKSAEDSFTLHMSESEDENDSNTESGVKEDIKVDCSTKNISGEVLQQMHTVDESTESFSKTLQLHIEEKEVEKMQADLNYNDKGEKTAQRKKIEHINNIVKKKLSVLIDSESEEESIDPTSLDKFIPKKSVTGKYTEEHVLTNERKISIPDSDSEIDENLDKPKHVRKKVLALVDSESEEDAKTKKKKVSSLVDTDDEDPAGENKYSKHINQETSKIIDTKREDELKSKQNIKKQLMKSKISALIDSDSESDVSGAEIEFGKSDLARNCNDEEEIAGETGLKKNPKKIRASAKKAMDEMQAIQSEQQRLHREAHINIPYHKPKRYTLQEFLRRRTIIKSQLPSDDSSPAAPIVRSRNLKMTQEELEEYAKLMDERAKEATEFFKSESESEKEEEFKDNEGVLDKVCEADLNDQGADNNVIVPDEDIVAEKAKNSQGAMDFETNIETPMMASYETSMETADTNAIISTEIGEGENIYYLDEQPSSSKHIITAEVTKENDMSYLEYQPLTSEPIITAAEIDNKATTGVTDDDDMFYLNDEPFTSKPIITEVVQLPNIDINSLHLNAITTTTPQVQNQKRNVDIKRLITEKHLTDSPSLKGDPNMLIDLETGDLIAKQPTGLDRLLDRFIATNKPRKSRTTETVDILSTENGILEISKVNIHVHEDNDPNKEQKPRAAYLKLKENLKSIIKKKRLEELQKKQDEEKEYNKCLMDDDDEEEEEIEGDEYETETKPKRTELLDSDLLVDDEENPLIENEADEIEDLKDEEMENTHDCNEDVELDGSDNDDNGEEYNEQENGEEADSESDTDEEETNDVNRKRKNRVVQGFQDDSDDEIEFLKPPAPITLPNASTLFELESNSTQFDAEDELMDLCSGQFGGTQKQDVGVSIISQIPMTQMHTGGRDETEELLELCSGTFDDVDDDQPKSTEATQVQTSAELQPVAASPPIQKCNKILSSDEEISANVGNATHLQNRIKKLTKRMKKKQAKLGFSDDEEEDEEDAVILSNSEDENLENVENVAETFIDYDSEENEIVVQMTKKDFKMRAENFVEKEAELSESEWGSADEDEKNLDKYDIELGDEDEFDREKLRTELGQIHARKMLDEDIREVRKIQEMLFEDEEKDGVGRQRQFKWKNAENGFSLDDSNREHNGDGENGESGDEENEHIWRKIRYEREQLLKERGLIESSQDHTSTTPVNSTNSTTIALKSATPNNNFNKKKINIITTKKTTTTIGEKKNSPFLITKASTASTARAGAAAMNKKTVRGSFLVRDKETLSKLAGLTKNNSGGVNDENGTAGTISVKAIKSKNFVFATLTEEEHENLKRKADDLMNSSNENGINYMKKPKFEPRRDKCLIDQLL